MYQSSDPDMQALMQRDMKYTTNKKSKLRYPGTEDSLAGLLEALRITQNTMATTRNTLNQSFPRCDGLDGLHAWRNIFVRASEGTGLYVTL